MQCDPGGVVPGLLNACGDGVGDVPGAQKTGCNIRMKVTCELEQHSSSSLELEWFEWTPLLNSP